MMIMMMMIIIIINVYVGFLLPHSTCTKVLYKFTMFFTTVNRAHITEYKLITPPSNCFKTMTLPMTARTI